jgi:hypothetical protein
LITRKSTLPVIRWITVRIIDIRVKLGLCCFVCGTCLQPSSNATDAGQPKSASSRALMALSRAGEARCVVNQRFLILV